MCIGVVSYAQDSLFIGKSITLPTISSLLCIRGEERVLEEKHKKIYDSVAKFLNDHENVHFEIRSYTDSRGSDSSNLALSQGIAQNWFLRLIEYGATAKQLKATGYGESNPRKVWIENSIYYLSEPKEFNGKIVVLTEEYINAFRKTNRNQFEMLHEMNRRTELVVISMDE